MACGAWHVSCIVSPDTRINTWDWTPPRVNIPVTADIDLFDAQQGAEDVSFSADNSGILQENSKVEDMVDEYIGYTGKDITTNNSYTQLMQCDKDHEKMDSVNLVQSATSVSNEHKEKDCYVVERSTDNTVQNETPKITVDTKVDNGNSKDSNSGVKVMKQRDFQKNKLAEGVIKKKRSHSAKSRTKYKTDKPQPKERNSLRRTSSAESVKPSAKPLHMSKSLCNIVLESEGKEEVIPERRSSTGTIKSTASRDHSMSAGIRNTGNQIQNTESLSLGSISAHEDVENCSASPLMARTPTDDTCNSPLPYTHVDLCKGVRTAQLNREKKAPRHLRRIPSVPKMVSI